MKSKVMVLMLTVVILGLAGAAYAEVLYYEGFNYTPEVPLPAASGGRWYNQIGGQSATVVAGSLTYPGMGPSTGNSIRLPQAVNAMYDDSLPEVLNTYGTYYFAAITLGNDGGGEGKFVSLRTYTSPRPPEMPWYDVQTGFSGTYGFGQLHDGAHEANMGKFLYDNGIHLFVWRIILQLGQDDLRYIYDPDLSAGEPDWDAARIDGKWLTYDMNVNYALKLCLMGSYQPDERVDEIRVATTWEEAVGIPEPATMLVLALGGGLALLRRHR